MLSKWTGMEQAERREFVRRMQEVAKLRHVRITWLSG